MAQSVSGLVRCLQERRQAMAPAGTQQQASASGVINSQMKLNRTGLAEDLRSPTLQRIAS